MISLMVLDLLQWIERKFRQYLGFAKHEPLVKQWRCPRCQRLIEYKDECDYCEWMATFRKEYYG